jgi:hypothetical protein
MILSHTKLCARSPDTHQLERVQLLMAQEDPLSLDTHALSLLLLTENPELSQSTATSYASWILALHREGLTVRAWMQLYYALTYTSPTYSGVDL